MRVVAVSDADIASGKAKAAAGRPIPVIMGSQGLDVVDGPIQQVYVVSGTLS